jgi:amino acid transporter
VIRRITQKPWFGPKRSVGWGWRVSSWQGAIVLLLFLFSMFGVIGYSRSTLTGALGAIIISGIFILVAFLTGDPPGGADFDTEL